MGNPILTTHNEQDRRVWRRAFRWIPRLSVGAGLLLFAELISHGGVAPNPSVVAHDVVATELPHSGLTMVADGPLLGLHLVALTGLGLAGVGGLCYRGWRPGLRGSGSGSAGLDRGSIGDHRGRAGSDLAAERDALLARNRVLSARMPAGCIVLDAELRVIEWNPAAARIFGYGEEEVAGRPLHDLIVPPDRRVRAAESIERMKAGDPFAQGIEEHLTRDGRRILCEWHDEVLLNPDRSISGYLCMVVDITERCRREDAYRESEARYRRLFESMIDGFARMEVMCEAAGDPVDCRFLEVNPAFERLTGRPLPAIVGHTAREVFGEMETQVLERFARVALHGESVHFERQFPVLDRWFEVAAFPIGGQQFGAVFADVTSRVKDRDALIRKDLELEAVFDQSPMIKLLVDQGGAVCRTNRAGREYFGLAEGEQVPVRVGELLGCLHGRGPTAKCPLTEECRLCELGPTPPDAVGSLGLPKRREVRLPVLKGGIERQAVFLVAVTHLQLGGRPLALLSLEDVTASREAEERLREQAALLASAHEAIYVLDLVGTVQFWNAGAERLYGWSEGEAVGQSVSELVFGGSGPMWANLCGWVREEGYWDGELLQVHRRAQQLIVDVRASLVRDSQGKPKSILMVASDLTERKQLERQLMRAQRLESLGTLACGVAHDLNNVLTPVQMVADLLRGLVPGSDAERLVDLLGRSARRGADIIRQLLLFGRGIESDRAEMDLRYLAKEVAKMLRETFPKSIQVQFEVPEDLWRVVGDVTQLHQVLLNLCVNARDAMLPKGGTMTLSASNTDLDDRAVRALPGATAGQYVLLEVADTGVGIPMEVLDRIFDPFFTTKPLGQGTGLGLATVQGIVRGHQGFVQVLSEVGVGSRFRIYLPVATVPVPAAAPEAPRRMVSGDQRWVLVVDDEEAICSLIADALRGAGYQVLTAGDGAEAISIFGRRHGDIAAVVVDMMMPFIDGAAAVTMFRKIKPSVAVVAMSGLPSQREEAEKVAGGRLVFLNKPFEVPELLSAVGQAVSSDDDPVASRVECFDTESRRPREELPMEGRGDSTRRVRRTASDQAVTGESGRVGVEPIVRGEVSLPFLRRS